MVGWYVVPHMYAYLPLIPKIRLLLIDYDMLHPEIKSKFTEIKYDVEKWKYLDKHTGRLYKLYTL
jgi:hypothetical protein